MLLQRKPISKFIILITLMILSSCDASLKNNSDSSELRLKAVDQGRTLFHEKNCSSCHGTNGVYPIPSMPSLKKSRISNNSLEVFVKAMVGLDSNDDSKVSEIMFEMTKKLSVDELAKIMTYIDNFEGNQNRYISPEDIDDLVIKFGQLSLQKITRNREEKKRYLATLSGGNQVYVSACQACHALGVAGAPKLNNRDDWKNRVTNGRAALYENSINGVGAMPARGGSYLSDDQVKKAVDYMLKNSGLKKVP